MVDTNSLAMMDPNSRRRVKLYMLNAERMWDDRGTGYISSMYMEKFRGMCLLVRSEEDGTVLMESKINLHTAYQKQQDTLIVWSEQANDFALSFQEKAGCDEIWEKICQEQGCSPSVNITKEVPMDPERGDDMNMDDDHNLDDMADATQLATNTTPIPLPPCELSKLEEIQEFISNYVMLPVHTERLAASIENEGYIKKLLALFHMCEDLEHTEGLSHLYEIFSNILKLNKNALYEIMFAEDTIFDVIGVLEYNPAKSQPRIKHREFLRTQANFKEVIPLNNNELVQRIHQLYRIQYIQDVILPTPTVFEETMLSTLTSYIFFMKAEIVTAIQEDKHFLKTMFSQILDDEVDEAKQRDLVLFLKEFCVFSQSLQPNCKDLFYKTLVNYGVLGAIEIVLGLEDSVMKTAALDIFSYVLECNPSMVREFIMQEAQQAEDEDLLINLVLDQMISDEDPELGGAVQLMGIIRLLVDPENMLGTTNKTEKSEFLNFFYKHSMHVLTAPLFANTVDSVPSKDDYQTAQLSSIILELLTFCIERHGYHVRNYVLQKDLIRRVLVLLKSNHAFLALAALRLVRRVIGLKDEFYNRYIVKGDLFAPIVMAFHTNGNKYNLLNSAMIELFDFIRVDDNKTLVTYVIEHHYKDFEVVSYVQTFKQLKKKYEDYMSGGGSSGADKPTLDSTPSILRNNRLRRDARSLEEEEEMWFDNDEDFEDTDNIMPMADMLKTRVDSADFEQFDKINKYLERNRYLSKENDNVKTPPRLHGGGININLNRSPSPTPPSSPEASPTSSPLSAATASATGLASSGPTATATATSTNPATTSPLGDRSNSPVIGGAVSPSSTASSSIGSSSSAAAAAASSSSSSSSAASSSSSAAAAAASSPGNTPSASATTTSAAATATSVTTKKPAMVGLVDYPDEDSEEEEEDSSDSAFPSPKRQRLST